MAILRVDVEPEHLLAFLEELQAGGLERLEKPWRVQMSFRWVWGGVGNLVYGWLWCVGGGGGRGRTPPPPPPRPNAAPMPAHPAGVCTSSRASTRCSPTRSTRGWTQTDD